MEDDEFYDPDTEVKYTPRPKHHHHSYFDRARLSNEQIEQMIQELQRMDEANRLATRTVRGTWSALREALR